MSTSLVRWLRCSTAGPNLAGSIPATAVAFRWRRNAKDPCTMRCYCTSKNTRWSKFTELSITPFLIIVLLFCHLKPQILSLSLAATMITINHEHTSFTQHCTRYLLYAHAGHADNDISGCVKLLIHCTGMTWKYWGHSSKKMK